MKAVIMAGGEGSRLRPLTCDLPKPMLPIMNIPIMEHIIVLLKAHGILDIAVTLMYLPQKIKNYFGDGSALGVNLHYFVENTPLGTAGSVKNTRKFLNETFIVISGDSLTDMDLTKAINEHKEKKVKGTIVLVKVEIPLNYGVAITNEANEITAFIEKPSWGEVFSDTVNTGTYILEPEVLEYFESGVKYDFSQDLFPKMLRKNDRIVGHITTDYWCDIGNINTYMQAHYDVFQGKIKLNSNTREIRKDIFVGANTVIQKNATINPPCYIGSNCYIGNDANISERTVIGDNTIIEDSVSIKRSIIWNQTTIEFGSELRASIICNKVKIKKYVSVFENAVIGEGCVINERSIIKPNIKIWPYKTIEPMAMVDRNIIWGSKHTKSIFGKEGISGIINVEISPEFATRLGASYGSIFKNHSKVLVSSTPSNSARMFKHAFISGILSVGLEVFNLSSLLTPMARNGVNYLPVEGGIHIKVSSRNPNKLIIDFMDRKGAGISRQEERKIENAFLKEDFNRCAGEDIHRLNNIMDYRDLYEKSILSRVNIKKESSKNPSICIVSPSNFVINMVASMLNGIGCNVSGYNYENIKAEGTIVEKIRKTNSEFAAFIDLNGEKLVLMDKAGNIVKGDKFLTLIALIIFKTIPQSKVVVPISAPKVIEEMARKYNSKVIRTKTSTQAIMEEMLRSDLLKGKNQEDITQFMLNFDAIAGLIIILGYLLNNNKSLTELLNEIPLFYMSKKKIFCPWEIKGKVMRTLITQKKGERIELIEGVKFNLKDGWVLILPDAEMPLCRIYAEGKTADIAENYALEFMDRIREIVE